MSRWALRISHSAVRQVNDRAGRWRKAAVRCSMPPNWGVGYNIVSMGRQLTYEAILRVESVVVSTLSTTNSVEDTRGIYKPVGSQERVPKPEPKHRPGMVIRHPPGPV